MTANRVFITGAGSGLGRAFAQQLAAKGAKLCIGDIDAAAGQKTADEWGGHFVKCDVRIEADLMAAAAWMQAEWGGVDLLINNAGVAQMGALADTSLEDWRWIIDINLLGTVNGCKAFAPHLAQTKGRILNIASMASFLHLPNAGSYSATKSAVLALSETLMLELEPQGIKTHVACPSFFRTDLAQNMRAGDDKAQAMTARLVERSRSGANDVAKRILDGMDRGEARILLDKRTRRALRMKNWLPFPRYLNGLRKEVAKLEARMARAS
jgi:NAD(P)-dependent dehydrogenase (short-subunit alcohol dehydrogenase family)